MDEQEAAERAALERRANKLFSGRVDFLLSAPQLKFLPEPTVPEIAFCGRSNVGKSSLLNALTGRKAIARASVTPGRTQELNFFEIGDPTLFRLVDMPGYGFAKAPVKVVEKWKNLVKTYLRGRPVLARTLVLVDGAIEHVPASLAKLVGEGGRIVTGMVDRGVTRLATGRKSGKALALLPLAEMGIPRLGAFDRPQNWSF